MLFWIICVKCVKITSDTCLKWYSTDIPYPILKLREAKTLGILWEFIIDFYSPRIKLVGCCKMTVNNTPHTQHNLKGRKSYENIYVNKCNQKACFSMVWGWRKGQEVKSHTLSVPIRFENLLGSYRVLLQQGNLFCWLPCIKVMNLQRLLKDNTGLKIIFTHSFSHPWEVKAGMER